MSAVRHNTILAGTTDLHRVLYVRLFVLLDRPYLNLSMTPPEPTTFGRELTEQVRVDSKVTERMVPLIVERCIAAVEASGKSTC